MKTRKAIVMLSFGTTYEETRKKNIGRLTELVKSRYPEVLVMEAYSSPTVRRILKNRDQIEIPSLTEAMEGLLSEGIQDLTVFPTHVLEGHEYDKCRVEFKSLSANFENASFGRPLLSSQADYELVTKALWKDFQTLLPKSDTQVIFMGHGTSHQADEAYERLEKAFQTFCSPEIIVTTVEGSLNIERALAKLNPEKKQVVLTPFMLVAGDHAVNDLAGEEDSLASACKEAGYEPVCMIRGIGEYEGVREVYLSHLQEVL